MAGEVEKLQRALEELCSQRYFVAAEAAIRALVGSLEHGGKVLICGNGGSAADAQHLAAELVGRQNFDRAALSGLALTVDTSALTAIGNDYGFDEVFSRQVHALARPGDVLIGLSTSGCSRNVVKAVEAAKVVKATSIAFTGREPRDLAIADIVFPCPSEDTAIVQELHITLGHIIFGLVELQVFGYPDGGNSTS